MAVRMVPVDLALLSLDVFDFLPLDLEVDEAVAGVAVGNPPAVNLIFISSQKYLFLAFSNNITSLNACIDKQAGKLQLNVEVYSLSIGWIDGVPDDYL